MRKAEHVAVSQSEQDESGDHADREDERQYGLDGRVASVRHAEALHRAHTMRRQAFGELAFDVGTVPRSARASFMKGIAGKMRARATLHACALCAQCSTGPEGRQGHTEMRPTLAELGRRMKQRRRLVFLCRACNTKWVRERVAPRQHRWIRLV